MNAPPKLARVIYRWGVVACATLVVSQVVTLFLPAVALALEGLPRAITGRPKQPYRAPDVPAFFGGPEPEYVGELLDPASVRRTGIFNPDAVAGLVRRCRAGLATGVGENQALVAILSTQLWHREFLDAPARARAAASSGTRQAAAGASIAA